nr:MAG TPA: hypothetical protein [Caudoviricetes sp.]
MLYAYTVIIGGELWGSRVQLLITLKRACHLMRCLSRNQPLRTTCELVRLSTGAAS